MLVPAVGKRSDLEFGSADVLPLPLLACLRLPAGLADGKLLALDYDAITTSNVQADVNGIGY